MCFDMFDVLKPLDKKSKLFEELFLAVKTRFRGEESASSSNNPTQKNVLVSLGFPKLWKFANPLKKP